jgi:ribosome-binding factor A
VTLKDWVAKHNLGEEKSSPKEIAELLELTDQKIKDCEVISGTQVSLDMYHAAVYAVSLPLAAAPLRAEGYRLPKASDGGHSLLFVALEFTADKTSKYRSILQEARIARNRTTYTSVGSHDKLEIDKLFATVRELRADVEKWLRKEHPELM